MNEKIRIQPHPTHDRKWILSGHSDMVIDATKIFVANINFVARFHMPVQQKDARYTGASGKVDVRPTQTAKRIIELKDKKNSLTVIQTICQEVYEKLGCNIEIRDVAGNLVSQSDN